jgi:hypothetical protein
MTFNLKTFSYPEYYIQEDWGLVTQSSTESVNLGLVSSPDTEREDYGSILTPQQELLDYQDQRKFIFDLDNALEERTYSYNERSIILSQSPDDYGSIGSTVTSFIDYGSIADNQTEALDYRYIYYTGDAYPYGTIEFSGSALYEPKLLYIHKAEGSGDFSGTKVEKSSFREIGSGSFSAFSGSAEVVGANPPDSTVLFEFSGTKVEKNTYSYNERAIFVFDGYDDYGFINVVQDYDDYGLLTDQVVYEDYGTLSSPFNETTYPYGTIQVSGSAVTEFLTQFIHVGSGSAEFSGIKVEKNTFREIGSGSFSAITGAAEVAGVNPPTSGLAIFSGTKVEKNTFRELGSGSFSTFSGSAEETGVNPPDQNLLFEIFGTKVEKSSFREIGSGSFSAITGAAEVVGANPPDSTVLFEFSGTKVEKNTYSYNERAIFIFDGYDDHGVISVIQDYDDYGLLTDQVVYEDYGSVNPPFNETTYPYGTIQVSGSAVTEFLTQFIHKAEGSAEFSGTKVEKNTFRELGSGTLSAITGAAEETGVNPPTSGLAIFSGTKVEKNTFRELGSGSFSAITGAAEETGVNPPTSGLAIFSGTKVEKNTFRELGSGSFSAITGAAEVAGVNPPDSTVLFEFSGTKVEKNTYSYNERSIILAQTPDDYGSIGSTATVFVDYGFIIDSELTTGVEDYRYIFNTADAYPFGTVEISGSALYEPKLLYVHKAEGSGDFSGTKVEKNTFRELGSGLFSAITGAAEVVGVNPPDSTVVLTFSGTKVEKSSLREIGSGSFSAITGAAEETGVNPPDSTVVLTFSGSASQSFIPSTEIGSGSFSAISGSAESRLVNPPDSTVLFEFSGTKVEKNTYSYNERAIFIFDGYDDHGIISVVQDYDDYGLLSDQVGYEDYGTLSSPFNETTYPYGTIQVSGSITQDVQVYVPYITGSGSVTFSGSAPQSFTPATEIGSGSFSAFSGSAEAIGVNPPDSTVLFNVSGTKVEKNTFREIGSGSATFSGTTIILSTPEWVGSGSAEFSGTKVEKNSFRELGSGTLSAITGAAESALVNPPDSTLLFNVSGTKVEKNTFREIGTGFVTISGSATNLQNRFVEIGSGSSTFSGSSTQSFTPATEIGSGSFSTIGGSAEATGVNPPDSTVLFEFSGSKVEKNTFSEIGSGSAEFSGEGTARKNPGFAGRGSSTFSGSAPQAFIPTAEIGSGSFSAFSGSAEATGVNPPDSTVLFEFSGSKVEKNTFSEIGSGSAEFSGEAIIALEALAIHVGEGSATFSGSAPQSFIPTTEIGSGSFSAFSGSAESTLVNPPDSTVLFEISGSYSNLKATYAHQGTGTLSVTGNAIQKSLPSYKGSGTLSAITGAAESTLINPPDSTVLFQVSGTKVEKNTFRELGSGSFSAIVGSVESIGANPPENTVLFEVSGTKVEKSTFREIGSGSVQVNGDSLNRPVFIYSGSGSATFSGSSTQSFTPATEIGSGSFSAIGGSAEVFGANPPENTVLFEFSGSKVEKNTFREIGSGSILFSGGITQNIQVYVPNITGSGIVSINETAIDKFRPNYKATGTIAIVGNGRESYTPTTEIGGGLIEINGVGVGTYIVYRQPYVFVTII